MRSGLAVFAVVLATLIVPVAVTATWLSSRVDSTEAYVDTVAPLADDPDLRDALAEELAAVALASLQDAVPVGLPDAFDAMVRTSARSVVASDGFPAFWRSANADAHREFLALVRAGAEEEADGYVVIDLGPLLEEVVADVMDELPVAVDLPPRAVPVPVVPESELVRASGLYRLLEGLAVWAPLLWVVLVGFAVAVAAGWRGRLRAGAAGAVGAAVGGAVVLLATGPVTALVVDQVDPAKQDLARLVVEVVVRTLDEAAGTVVVGGLVIGVLLAGASLWPRRRAPASHP